MTKIKLQSFNLKRCLWYACTNMFQNMFTFFNTFLGDSFWDILFRHKNTWAPKCKYVGFYDVFCSTFEFLKGGHAACSIKLHGFSFDVKYSNFLWLWFFFLIRPFHKNSFEFKSRLDLIINNHSQLVCQVTGNKV